MLALLGSDVLFGWYSIGLAIGFFGYFAVGLRLLGQQEVLPWQIPPIPPTSTLDSQSDAHKEASTTENDNSPQI
jgi:hypothetical protein